MTLKPNVAPDVFVFHFFSSALPFLAALVNQGLWWLVPRMMPCVQSDEGKARPQASILTQHDTAAWILCPLLSLTSRGLLHGLAAWSGVNVDGKGELGYTGCGVQVRAK